jgi:hypothetical protein
MKDNKLPLYKLVISDDEDGTEEVDYVALVEFPAIQKNFLAFNENFVEPNKGESKEEFLPRCISYIIDEGKDSQEAVAICSSLWEQHFAANKVSFDYDDTLSTDRGKKLAESSISEGNIVYIISARDSVDGMLGTAKELGIPESRVYATGSNSAKIEKVKELGIAKHYDNNAFVIAELGTIGQKFNLELKFAIQNEAERIVSGPLMVADMPIYRRDDEGEYYVVFTAEEIKKIVQRFFKKGYQAKVNIEHDTPVDGVYMFESFLVDRAKGVYPMKGFSDIADGSWFGSFKVDNDAIWNQVVDGTFKGFSVEGLFKYEKTPNVMTKDDIIMSEVIKILSQIEH